MKKNILYVLLHTSMQSDRYFNVKETWGKSVDCLFCSDHEDPEKNIIKASDRIDYYSAEEKHINGFKYVVSNNIKDYEWFFFCDNDTFVNTEKLESLLSQFDKDSVHGSVLNGHWPADRSLNFCSGGAGYLIHNELLDKITQNISILNTGLADVTLGLCLRELGIKSVNHNLFNSQPPAFHNIPINETKNYITFHYIKTLEEMQQLLNEIKE